MRKLKNVEEIIKMMEDGKVANNKYPTLTGQTCYEILKQLHCTMINLELCAESCYVAYHKHEEMADVLDLYDEIADNMEKKYVSEVEKRIKAETEASEYKILVKTLRDDLDLIRSGK